MIRLRRLRRLTAIAAHLLLLQLVFTSAAGACPLGDGMAKAADAGTGHARQTHAAHSEMEGAGVDAGASLADARTTAAHPSQLHAPVPAPTHHHSGTHCDMACAPASCGAGGHCSTSVASSSATSSVALTSAYRTRIAGSDDALRSVSIAPEPPPPRG